MKRYLPGLIVAPIVSVLIGILIISLIDGPDAILSHLPFSIAGALIGDVLYIILFTRSSAVKP